MGIVVISDHVYILVHMYVLPSSMINETSESEGLCTCNWNGDCQIALSTPISSVDKNI